MNDGRVIRELKKSFNEIFNKTHALEILASRKIARLFYTDSE